MSSDDPETLRREILSELAPLLYDRLAAEDWGRALVRVGRRDDGSLRITGIDVEDIVGDDARIDAAMGSAGAREILPVLSRATEALAATYDVDLDAVEGGTFLRRVDGSFGWLPGLVRAPSAPFEERCDPSLALAAQRLDGLTGVIGQASRHRFELDVEGGTVVFFDDAGAPCMRAGLTVLGSFARAACTWVWGWANPSTPAAGKERSQALCDACPHRGMWEIATPQFASDEGTAWAISAIVAYDVPDGVVLRVPRDDGAVFFLLRNLAPVTQGTST